MNGQIKIFNSTLVKNGFPLPATLLHSLDASNCNLSVYSEEKGYLIYQDNDNNIIVYDTNDGFPKQVIALKENEKLY